jgi:hypothetical protein
MEKNGSSHSLVKTLIISCISLTNTQPAPRLAGAHETKFNGYLQRLNLQIPATSHEKTHNPSKLPSPDLSKNLFIIFFYLSMDLTLLVYRSSSLVLPPLFKYVKAFLLLSFKTLSISGMFL